jgi:hypothetical protein
MTNLLEQAINCNDARIIGDWLQTEARYLA